MVRERGRWLALSSGFRAEGSTPSARDRSFGWVNHDCCSIALISLGLATRPHMSQSQIPLQGICASSGVIHDFAGPYFISVDNFAFGTPTRYSPARPPTAVRLRRTARDVAAPQSLLCRGMIEALETAGFRHHSIWWM